MIRVALAALVLAAIATNAAADDDPWEVGVPEERQDQANALFAEGNELFSQRAHGAALEKYKAAIAIWDHPMIRFNMAVTLIRLDRVLEADEALERALRFGDKPFTPELYQQALAYQTLVRKQLGDLSASCEQAGTRVLLDGKPWFTCPGSATIRVTAGEHSLVAEGKRFLTLGRRLVIGGGTTAHEKLSLVPIEAAMLTTYRHPRWIPWTVLGAGVVVAVGGGAGFYVSGKNRMADFANAFFRECPAGCEADLSTHPDLARQRDAAQLRYTLSTTFIVGGSAIAITGVVWAVLNRGRRVLPQVEVSPARGGGTATASWRF